MSGTGPTVTHARGLERVVVEGVTPQVDGGRFPIKRVVGEAVVVEADVFSDGHEAVACAVRWRRRGERRWNEERMSFLENDRWRAEFVVEELCPYEYTVVGWIDHFAGWQRDLRKKHDALQPVSVELLAGAELVAQLTRGTKGAARKELAKWIDRLEQTEPDPEAGLSEELAQLVDEHAQRTNETTYDQVFTISVGPPDARYSTWYELFPRSATTDPSRHGTFADVEDRLPYVKRMGFDVLYLPPIHPIGVTKRKGKNNSVVCEKGDVGSPWAIGSEDGGHTAIHPGLGSLADLERLVTRARSMGIEIAMDLAFQCSPDHPWVKEHPEWFKHRPDGTIQFAENPPKRYEDIYPLDFSGESWFELWSELKSVTQYWIDRGVRIFRVDNPHTKPFGFWQWLIGEIKKDRPDVIFLSESFTRPKVMYRLAKVGFDQSYTYFTWRNTKWEIEEYFTELTKTDAVDFFRPNLWPNTPDILPEYLQYGGRAAFMSRLVLAATLGASYGIYGPAYELCLSEGRPPDRHEYLDNEKYEIKASDLDEPSSLSEFIGHVNRIRHENAALHSDRSLRFHEVQNDNLVAYSKQAGDNLIICVVNVDPHHAQSGMLRLPLHEFGMSWDESFQVHDLLTDARYVWNGEWNYVSLDPNSVPAHVFRIERRVAREQDFDYFM